MNQSRPTGLGDPEPFGKRSLFKPPENERQSAQKSTSPDKDKQKKKSKSQKSPNPKQRIRTTMEITNQAMAVLQDIQNHHRLETGKALPLWKVVSQAIEFYGEAKKGDG